MDSSTGTGWAENWILGEFENSFIVAQPIDFHAVLIANVSTLVVSALTLMTPVPLVMKNLQSTHQPQPSERQEKESWINIHLCSLFILNKQVSDENISTDRILPGHSVLGNNNKTGRIAGSYRVRRSIQIRQSAMRNEFFYSSKYRRRRVWFKRSLLPFQLTTWILTCAKLDPPYQPTVNWFEHFNKHIRISWYFDTYYYCIFAVVIQTLFAIFNPFFATPFKIYLILFRPYAAALVSTSIFLVKTLV